MIGLQGEQSCIQLGEVIEKRFVADVLAAPHTLSNRCASGFGGVLVKAKPCTAKPPSSAAFDGVGWLFPGEKQSVTW